MLSAELLKSITDRGMSYIVAARLANAPQGIIDQVCKGLGQQDGRMIRVPSAHGDMVCSFSAKRYKKDKHTHEKALTKAELLISKAEPGKRAKFVKTKAKDSYELDKGRVQRAEHLLGVKGYCTNIPPAQLDNASVIARYHDLWHVEKAFRMAKSDLATRPIFHFNATAIRVHLLICFLALVMARAIEMRTGVSLRQTIDALWKVTDARLYHRATKQQTVLRSVMPKQTETLLALLGVPY